MQQFNVTYEPPNVSEFSALRATIGWGNTCLDMASVSLNNSLFHVTVREGEKLIAMGRVIGDGAMFFYVQDVVVDPSNQNQGLGKLVMEHIEAYLAKVVKKGATVGLLASKGKEGFYQKFGYCARNGENLGMGMCKFVK
ncbi:GNAT family N-acetyltransferase [Thalassotalea fusca]